MAEFVKLQNEQHSTRARLKLMKDRMQLTEQRQHQVMTFLARAIRSPEFLQQLFQQKEKRKESGEAICRKRKRPIEEGPKAADAGSSTLGASLGPTKCNHRRSHEMCGNDVLELESLALGIRDFGGVCRDEEQERLQQVKADGELNDEFWEELLNESNGEEGSMSGVHDEDVDRLVHSMGCLSPTAPR